MKKREKRERQNKDQRYFPPLLHFSQISIEGGNPPSSTYVFVPVLSSQILEQSFAALRVSKERVHAIAIGKKKTMHVT